MTALSNPPSSTPPHGHSTRCAYPKAKRLRPDMRTRAARRAKALELAVCAALGIPDGKLPVLLRSLVDSAVIAQVRLDEIRAAVARGEPVDDEMAQRWSGILHRAYDVLGLSPAAGKPDPRAGLPTDAELRAKGINI